MPLLSGRASRSEYWWFALANIIAQIVATIIDSSILHSETPAVSGLLSLALLIPGLAVSVRRLHDIGKSGWNLLWAFLPLIGIIPAAAVCRTAAKVMLAITTTVRTRSRALTPNVTPPP